MYNNQNTMVENVEADFLAEQITKRINSLSSEYYKHVMQEEFEAPYDHDYDTFSKAEMMDWVHDTLKRILRVVLGFLNV
ncbi:hypothetical protein ACTHQF_01080 [Pedobacter sp. SAFR-022]|uniref:hypothetical protein n=1 Tax=Pedobacter sp. SAFR-022 TaxID=3436861 RepID=UPI003F7D8915